MSTVIWSIAGSDNSGGAGIQADLATVASFNALAPLHLCTVITAVTAQGPDGLLASVPVSLSLLQQQVQALLPSHLPSVIKLGLIGNSEQLHYLLELLPELKRQKADLLVVCDPVQLCSSGGKLNSADLSPAQWQRILPYIDIITPNLPELHYLSQQRDVNDAIAQLLTLGVGAVLSKGGHSDDLDWACDTLQFSQKFRYRGNPPLCQQAQLCSPRQSGSAVHGTGCALSMALCCALAAGFAAEDAFVLAKMYLDQGITAARRINGYRHLGHAPALFHRASLPALRDSWRKTATAFAPLKEQLGLYLIVPDVPSLQQAIASGARTVQLRLKQHCHSMLRQQIRLAVHLAQQAGVQLFINDHWQLALELGAYGVHLGQEDIEQADVAAIARAGLRLGISCHGLYRLLRAEQLEPSYLAIGAVFATDTKDMRGKLQGLDKLPLYSRLFSRRPLVAIGGINAENAGAVLACGIRHLAMVSAFAKAVNKTAFVRQLQQQLQEYRYVD